MEAWRATITKILLATRACYRFFSHQVLIPKQAFRHFCKSHFQFRMSNFLALRAIMSNLQILSFLLSSLYIVNIYTIPFVYNLWRLGGQQLPTFCKLRQHVSFFCFIRVKLFLNSLVDTFVKHIFSSEDSNIKFSCATRKILIVNIYTIPFVLYNLWRLGRQQLPTFCELRGACYRFFLLGYNS